MKKLLSVIASVFVLCSCTKVSETDAVPAMESVETETPTVTTAAMTTETVVTTAETLPPVTAKTVTFTALGDNLIHSSIYKQAARRAEGNGYDFEYAYAGAADLLDRTDITVLNQETLICNDKYEPSTYPRFNSPTALGDYMAELGVDVFTIANNHTLDMGTDGLSICLDYYDERGMIRVGAYRNEEDMENIRILEKDGVKVSFLCYTESLNGLSLPADSPLIIGRYDRDTVINDIKRAKEISDICIVSLHWGLENSGTVEDYQRDAAKAYSLGNFISAQSVGTNLIGGVLDFGVTVEDGAGNVICDEEFTPIVTHYDGNFSNVRLYKLSDYTPEMAMSHGVRANSRFDYDYIIEYLTGKGLYDLNN